YGVTNIGGSSGSGTIFEFDPVTNIYVKKYDFIGTNNGVEPLGLIRTANGLFYGLTVGGGANSYGTIFEYDPINNIYQKKLDLDNVNTGSNPHQNLISALDGKLYGLTSMGGSNNKGVLFEFDPITNIFTKHIDFDGLTNGSTPQGQLVQASSGRIYGTTYKGGLNDMGTVFEFDPINKVFRKTLDFAGVNGKYPYGGLIEVKKRALPVGNNLLYPNPFSTTAVLETGTLNSGQLVIYDVLGQEVKNFSIQGNRTYISSEGLPSGLYVYKIGNGNDHKISGKFIIIH
ncbi:MAG TPA: T9SS type A sorting domain-containing protein, partial [Nitrosopumilaceae archaeon]|nr:T9SS type A sorting domain-containing protein [Nitrosopumilaceae archaeon]